MRHIHKKNTDKRTVVSFRNTCLLFFVLLFAPCAAHAQATFEKRIDFTNRSTGLQIISLSDGGYFVGGYSRDTNNSSIYIPIVIKIAAKGNVEWSRSLDSSLPGIVTSLTQTPDGTIAAAGYGYTANSGRHFFMETYTPAGDLLWSHRYDDGRYLANPVIASTSDTGYIASVFDISSWEIFLTKLRRDGTIQWTKVLKSAFSGISAYPTKVVQLQDGSYILGSTDYDITAFGGIFTMKFTSDGSLLWQNDITSTIRDRVVIGSSLIVTSDGGIVHCGIIEAQEGTGPTVPNLFITKMDSLGKIQWTKTIDVFGPAMANSIVETGSGDLLVAGSVSHINHINGAWQSDSALILKLHGNGDFISANILQLPGMSTEAHSIDRTKDHGFIITGGAGKEIDNFIWGGVLLVKIDSMVTNCHFSTSFAAVHSEGSVAKSQFDPASDLLTINKGLRPIPLNMIATTDLCSISSVTDRQLPEIHMLVLPNPLSSAAATLSFYGPLTPGVYDLTIYDLLGNAVYKEKIDISAPISDVSLDVSGLPAGSYTIELRSKEGQMITLHSKFIKE